ncbi:hypothetical protein MRX96_014339 [Rhipicephalus microplus]
MEERSVRDVAELTYEGGATENVVYLRRAVQLVRGVHTRGRLADAMASPGTPWRHRVRSAGINTLRAPILPNSFAGELRGGPSRARPHSRAAVSPLDRAAAAVAGSSGSSPAERCCEPTRYSSSAADDRKAREACSSAHLALVGKRNEWRLLKRQLSRGRHSRPGVSALAPPFSVAVPPRSRAPLIGSVHLTICGDTRQGAPAERAGQPRCWLRAADPGRILSLLICIRGDKRGGLSAGIPLAHGVRYFITATRSRVVD